MRVQASLLPRELRLTPRAQEPYDPSQTLVVQIGVTGLARGIRRSGRSSVLRGLEYVRGGVNEL